MILQQTYCEKTVELLTAVGTSTGKLLEEFESYTSNPIEKLLAYSKFVSKLEKLQIKQEAIVSLHHQNILNKNVVVSNNLKLQLLQTDYDCDVRLFKLPFSSICIIPENKLKLETGEHPISEIYVTQIENVLIVTTYLTFIKDNKDYFNTVTNVFKLFETGLIKKSFNEMLTTTLKEYPTIAKENCEQLFGFVVNVILYINSKGADSLEVPVVNLQERIQGKSPKKQKKLNEKLGNASRCPFILLGQHQKYKCETQGTGKPLDNKIYVRGHWRGQWYGSANNKVLKPLWIEPYSKGSDISEIVNNKPYKL